MQGCPPVSEWHFHWHAAAQTALRRSFSNAGREQFPNYPPDGTFLPEIRFQAAGLQRFFYPADQLQNQTLAPGKEADENTSLGGSTGGPGGRGGWAATVCSLSGIWD